jgi:AcrR family transcriptional regulator
VGMGSFYNHFESKEQLFHAAVEEALDAHGALLDRLSADTDDPAEGLRAQFPAHRAPSPPTAPIEQRPAPQRLRDRHRRQGNRAPCPSRYRGSSLSRPLQRL